MATRHPSVGYEKIRQVNGAGELDVVYLYRGPEGGIWYQVPLYEDDVKNFDLYGDFRSEEEALKEGYRHLADLANCSLKEYMRRIAAGE